MAPAIGPLILVLRHFRAGAIRFTLSLRLNQGSGREIRLPLRTGVRFAGRRVSARHDRWPTTVPGESGSMDSSSRGCCSFVKHHHSSWRRAAGSRRAPCSRPRRCNRRGSRLHRSSGRQCVQRCRWPEPFHIDPGNHSPGRVHLSQHAEGSLRCAQHEGPNARHIGQLCLLRRHGMDAAPHARTNLTRCLGFVACHSLRTACAIASTQSGDSKGGRIREVDLHCFELGSKRNLRDISPRRFWIGLSSASRSVSQKSRPRTRWYCGVRRRSQ